MKVSLAIMSKNLYNQNIMNWRMCHQRLLSSALNVVNHFFWKVKWKHTFYNFMMT